MTRGRLRAYARYQLVDFLLQRATLPTIAIAAFGAMTWYAAGASAGLAGEQGEAFAEVQFRTLGSLFVALAVVIFIGSGIYAFSNLPIEAFPDVTDT